MIANFAEVEQISGTCDGQHKHDPWGYEIRNGKRVFATSLEVHYPTALCDKIANTIAIALQKRGINISQHVPINLAARSLAQNQPATNKVTPIVPEFKPKCVAIFLQNQCIWPAMHQFLDSAKVLQKVEVGGECLQSLVECILEQCRLWNVDVQLDLAPNGLVFPCVVNLRCFGIFWKEEEFVEQAIKAKHPLSLESALPRQLLDSIHRSVYENEVTIARVRAEFFAKWTKRAVQLDMDEKALKAGMHADVARAVRNKRILLFEEMLRATNFPDMGVVDELRLGSDLTGEIPLTNMLPGRFEPALISEQELQRSAERVRKAAIHGVRSSGDNDLDDIVWQKTMEEVDKGWLIGPLHDNQVPADRPLSRRFGLRQKQGKERLIDDFSESGVNASVTVSESPSLHTVDVACASLMVWFSLCKGARINSDLVVRTFDLASAYRQVGLSERGQKFAFLRVYNPKTKRACFFKCLVLPFGAVRSVHSARALWWIGVVGCWIVWTSFYDDFISFSRPCLAGSAEQSVTALFKLLGWIFAEEGDKAQPFDLQCSALGVLLDLSVASTGVALVCNTKTRCAELCDDLHKVVEGGSLTSKNAQRLRGRM